MAAAPAIRVVAYSDYLCPWCYNASVRLCRLERELAPRVELVWRSYLLRPEPEPGRDVARFRAYTESWLRPAAEPDAGTFRVWQGEASPPSHSVPAQRAARAAARLGREAFARMHERLFRAYFAENRDVSDRETLRALWREACLDEAAFAAFDDPMLEEEIRAEHREAVDLGVHGVPAVRIEPNDVATVGAHPLEVYRRWFLKRLAAD